MNAPVNGSIMSFLMIFSTHLIETTVPDGRSTAAGFTLFSACASTSKLHPHRRSREFTIHG